MIEVKRFVKNLLPTRDRGAEQARNMARDALLDKAEVILNGLNYRPFEIPRPIERLHSGGIWLHYKDLKTPTTVSITNSQQRWLFYVGDGRQSVLIKIHNGTVTATQRIPEGKTVPRPVYRNPMEEQRALVRFADEMVTLAANVNNRNLPPQPPKAA